MAIRIGKSLSGIFHRKKQKSKEQIDFPIWDMHCHILPGVDDGSRNIEDSLKMIEMEMAQGVTRIMLTPHYIVGKTDAALIQKKYVELQEAIKQRNYPVELFLGNELLYNTDMIEELRAGRALTLAGTSYVLVEFHIGVSYQRMKQAFQELLMAGYRPILAHMERFECLHYQWERVYELVDMGIYMQANANSFQKEETGKFLMGLLEEECIHFIGTDSHRPDWRPPQMKAAIEMLQMKLRKEDILQLLAENSNKILNNNYI